MCKPGVNCTEVPAEMVCRAAARFTQAACLVASVQLPDGDGLALQVELAQERPWLPLVFLSATPDIPACVRAVRAGAVDFLTKPVLRAAIRETVGLALARRVKALSSKVHGAAASLGGGCAGEEHLDSSRRMPIPTRDRSAGHGIRS